MKQGDVRREGDLSSIMKYSPGPQPEHRCDHHRTSQLGTGAGYAAGVLPTGLFLGVQFELRPLANPEDMPLKT